MNRYMHVVSKLVILAIAAAAAYSWPEIPAPSPILKGRLAAAFEQALRGTPLAGAQISDVHVLGRPFGRRPDAPLVAGHARFDRSRGWVQAEMRCRDASACLPFFAAAHLDSAPVVSPQPSTPARAKTIVQRGEHARLVLIGRSARITLPVVSLEFGSAGQRIRVRVQGARTIYRARVIAPGLLEGEYQP